MFYETAEELHPGTKNSYIIAHWLFGAFSLPAQSIQTEQLVSGTLEQLQLPTEPTATY